MPTLNIVIVVLLIGATVAIRIVMRQRHENSMGRHEADTAYARLDEIARRLGLTRVEGDPTLNLATFYFHRQQDIQNALQRWHPAQQEVRAYLMGEVQGRRTEFVLQDRIDVDSGLITGREVVHQFHARIAVAPRAWFPDFELYLRDPAETLKANPQRSLPLSSLGDPMLDARFEFRCADGRVGPLFAPVLGALAPFAYVHVIGRDGVVSFTMTPMGLMATSRQYEAIVHVLVSIAAIIEGAPVPGTLGTQVQDSAGAGGSDEQIPVPCTRCGAAMEPEPGSHLHADVIMHCPYCRQRETLPASASERVRALRARLAQLRWAQEVLTGSEMFFVKLAEHFKSPFVWGGYIGLIALVVLISVQQFQQVNSVVARLSYDERLEVYRSALLSPTIVLGAVVGTLLGYIGMISQYRRKIRPLMLARAPMAEGAALRCRRCGGNLPTSKDPFVSCAFCQAQNLVTMDVARERAARLDAEVREYQARAAGVTAALTEKGFSLNMFYGPFVMGIGIVIVLALVVNYAVLPLLIEGR